MSCKEGLKNENGVVFESEKLIGKYTVIIEAIENNKIDKFEFQLAKGLAKMMNIEMELNFYKNNQGLFKMDLGWIDAFADPKNLKNEFTYKLEQDSILVISSDDKKIQRLVIKKFSDTFDYIELIDRDANQSLSMKKIIE